METISANDLMKAYAEDAIKYAAELQKDLDHTTQSIQVLEDICALLHKKKNLNFLQRLFIKPPTEKSIIDMATRLGAYLGEVIRNKTGGEWKIEDPTGEGNTMVLQLGDVKIFPVARVYRRLKDGNENNVWHYYQSVTQT
jgi:hypothetical protein